MKHSNTCLALLAFGGVALGGLSPLLAQSYESRQPIVITPPARPDGSNRSRAPFLAERKFDDARPADGQPIDIGVPPNTPATNPEPHPLPPPTVAILGPRPDAAPAAVATVPVATETPALSMTGRPTVGVSTTLETTRIVPSIRSASFASREQVLSDIESRLGAADKSLAAMRGTTAEMSASGRTQFKASDDAVKERERTLRESLRAARNASSSEWDSARSKLAADFEAYASALASLDAAAGIAPMR